jgi:hypothetical protein
MNLRFKMEGIFCIAEEVLAFKEGLCVLESVSLKRVYRRLQDPCFIPSSHMSKVQII